MNSIALLREQLKSAHETMEATMADVTPQVAHFAQTNKAIPVGAAYAHCVLSEDMIVSQMLAKKKPLYESNSEVGVSEMMPTQGGEWDKHEQWYKTVQVDLPKIKSYAQKVYSATDNYLASLEEADLDNVIEVPGMGKMTLAAIFSGWVLLHIANLTGEVSAAKGLQGLKGYPF